MKRNYKLKPIKNIIESFVEQDSISDGIFNIKIQKAWENAVEKKNTRLYQRNLCQR